MDVKSASKYLTEAVKLPYLNHFFIEGGEPFLYPEILKTILKEASSKGFWIGVLTNGFWATSDKKAKEVLIPLLKAGLIYLGISTDAWHSQFIEVDKPERAAKIARQLGIEVDLMVCSGGPNSEKVFSKLNNDGFSFHPGKVRCRGRAFSSQACQDNKHYWKTLNKCLEDFGGSSRVHIGPNGEIHLCQGLLLGENSRFKPLSKIFANFSLNNHPICAALQQGGPAELAKFAKKFGFMPQPNYTDGCQLCFEVRSYLKAYFPKLIGPKELYLNLNLASQTTL
jgi:hypothetical protein